MSVVDVEQLREVTNLEVAFVAEIALLWVSTARDDAKELREAASLKDATRAVRVAHSLKGSSANLGIDRVRKLAEALELRARAGELLAADQDFVHLDDAISAAARWFDDWVHTHR